MKIDMHMHSAELSSCSRAPVKELLRSAAEVGLDAVVLTEHHRFRPAGEMEALNREFAPLKVFQGIEMTVPRRGSYDGDDLLLYGVHDPVLEEQRDWTYEELYGMVRHSGGWITLAHPLRYSNRVVVDVWNHVPDAVEIHSTNLGCGDTPEILELIRQIDSRPIQNSDSHYREYVGIYHIEVPGDTPETEEELLAMLRQGPITLHSDPDRIAAFNHKVEQQEALIRDFIAQGKTAEDYVRETGRWVGYYNRVNSGRSYRI